MSAWSEIMSLKSDQIEILVSVLMMLFETIGNVEVILESKPSNATDEKVI